MVNFSWTNGGDHYSFGIASQRIFQEPCEDWITIRNKRLQTKTRKKIVEWKSSCLTWKKYCTVWKLRNFTLIPFFGQKFREMNVYLQIVSWIVFTKKFYLKGNFYFFHTVLWRQSWYGSFILNRVVLWQMCIYSGGRRLRDG